MEYFHVMEDHRVKGPVFTLSAKELSMEAVMKQIPLKEQVETSDFLCIRQPEETCYLVSTTVQSVLEKVDENIQFIPVQLVDLERKRMEVYWKMTMDSKERVILNSFEKQEDMVLAYGETAPVLMLKEQRRNYLLVSLPVAEMLLRRQVVGMKFSRAKQQKD